MKSARGGQDRISTKQKLAAELVILGRVLAEARDRAGLKQSEVAARLEVPASYLSKIESGTRRLDVVELIRIAQAMEIDPATVIDEIAARIGGVRED